MLRRGYARVKMRRRVGTANDVSPLGDTATAEAGERVVALVLDSACD